MIKHDRIGRFTALAISTRGFEMRRSLTWLAIALLTFLCISQVLADDFMPPLFRGEPLTYTATWEFTNDPGPGDIWPDAVGSVGDGMHELFSAQTHTHRNTDLVFWNQDGFLYTQGLPGQLACFLTNWVDPFQFKHVWIQVTYSSTVQPPYVSGVLGADDSLQWPDPYIGYFVYRINVDANHFVEYWILQPNPNMEYIYLELPPFTSVDEIVIDTWSTESPVANEDRTWGDVKSLFR
jgi:hypothetical protein